MNLIERITSPTSVIVIETDINLLKNTTVSSDIENNCHRFGFYGFVIVRENGNTNPDEDKIWSSFNGQIQIENGKLSTSFEADDYWLCGELERHIDYNDFPMLNPKNHIAAIETVILNDGERMKSHLLNIVEQYQISLIQEHSL